MLTLTAHILSWNNTACAWLLHKDHRQIREAFHKKKVFGYLPKVFLEALVPVSLSLLVTVFMI